MIQTKNLAQAFASFSDTWSPRIAADIGAMQLKLAEFEGAFHWHQHEVEDELFPVQSGRLRIELRDQAPLHLGPGDFVVIPHGVEHRPVAETPCEVILLEPRTTVEASPRREAQSARAWRESDGEA